MAAIEDDARFGRDQLEASRPDRRREPVANVIVSHVVEQMRRRDREGGVDRLIVTDQRQVELAVLETRSLHCDDMTVPSPRSRLDENVSAKHP